jgi:hypothetical protein
MLEMSASNTMGAIPAGVSPHLPTFFSTVCVIITLSHIKIDVSAS